jgi:hypothetical protein
VQTDLVISSVIESRHSCQIVTGNPLRDPDLSAVLKIRGKRPVMLSITHNSEALEDSRRVNGGRRRK